MFSFTEHLLFWTKQIKRLTVAFSLATNLKLCDISQKSTSIKIVKLFPALNFFCVFQIVKMNVALAWKFSERQTL